MAEFPSLRIAVSAMEEDGQFLDNKPRHASPLLLREGPATIRGSVLLNVTTEKRRCVETCTLLEQPHPQGQQQQQQEQNNEVLNFDDSPVLIQRKSERSVAGGDAILSHGGGVTATDQVDATAAAAVIVQESMQLHESVQLDGGTGQDLLENEQVGYKRNDWADAGVLELDVPSTAVVDNEHAATPNSPGTTTVDDRTSTDSAEVVFFPPEAHPNRWIVDEAAVPVFVDQTWYSVRQMALDRRNNSIDPCPCFVVVNIQHSPDDFASKQLDNYVWSDELVALVLRLDSFVAWQMKATDAKAKAYMDTFQVNSLPHVAIVNPENLSVIWKMEGLQAFDDVNSDVHHWPVFNVLTAEHFVKMAMFIASNDDISSPVVNCFESWSCFDPPTKYIHKAYDLAHIISVARDSQRWVVVNVQSDIEFASHALNRDVWNHDLIRLLLLEGCIFWQVANTTCAGMAYELQYDVTAFPHVAIIDPTTGGILWRKDGWKTGLQEKFGPASVFVEAFIGLPDRKLHFCHRAEIEDNAMMAGSSPVCNDVVVAGVEGSDSSFVSKLSAGEGASTMTSWECLSLVDCWETLSLRDEDTTLCGIECQNEKLRGESSHAPFRNSDAAYLDAPIPLRPQPVSFQQTRLEAKLSNRWILVNIQSKDELASHALNLCVWRDENIRQLISSRFTFWQQFESDIVVDGYKKLFPVSSAPYIAVHDSSTGQVIWKKEGWCWSEDKPWTCEEIMKALDDVPFYSQGSEHDLPRYYEDLPPETGDLGDPVLLQLVQDSFADTGSTGKGQDAGFHTTETAANMEQRDDIGEHLISENNDDEFSFL